MKRQKVILFEYEDAIKSMNWLIEFIEKFFSEISRKLGFNYLSKLIGQKRRH